MFSICTFNASKVAFIHFLFERQIQCSFYRKTIWMDVKFLDGSFFKNRIRTEFRLSAYPFLWYGALTYPFLWYGAFTYPFLWYGALTCQLDLCRLFYVIMWLCIIFFTFFCLFCTSSVVCYLTTLDLCRLCAVLYPRICIQTRIFL